MDKQATKPEEQKLIDQRTTYLLIPSGEVEDRICRAWIEKAYGDNFRAQVVSAIPIVRLTDQNHLLVVARKKIRPITRRQQGPGGMPEDYPIAIEELTQEVSQRGPLRVADYWLEATEVGGSVDQTRLIVALNQISQPFCVRYRADEGLLRLFYL
jgi:hypothetical protein